jgi:hypothetical protein
MGLGAETRPIGRVERLAMRRRGLGLRWIAREARGAFEAGRFWWNEHVGISYIVSYIVGMAGKLQ